MKQIHCFIGSPRLNGNTACMVSLLTKALSAGNFSINSSFLYDSEILPCTDCRLCKEDELNCPVDDGMLGLYQHIMASDILIFATPIYWFGPSGQMKLLIDRLRPFFGNRRLEGKKAALLLPAGSGPDNCDLTIEQFRRSFDALGISFLGAAVAKAYNVGDIEKDDSSLATIEQLAQMISE